MSRPVGVEEEGRTKEIGKKVKKRWKIEKKMIGRDKKNYRNKISKLVT